MTSENLPEIIDAPAYTVVSASEAQARAEYDIAITTARRYPRDVKVCINEAKASACITKEVAASCTFAKPVKEWNPDTRQYEVKHLRGASVRLAEIVSQSWEHLVVESNVIEETDAYLVAEGRCRDLQKNVAARVTVRRGIIGSKEKGSKKYPPHVIENVAAAACSIALRNAVFKVVPKAFVEEIRLAALKVATGGDKPLEKQVETLLRAYEKRFGLDEARVCSAVGKKSGRELTLEDVEILVGLGTSIKEDEVSVDDAFPVPEASGADMAATKMGSTDKATSASKLAQSAGVKGSTKKEAPKKETAAKKPAEEEKAAPPQAKASAKKKAAEEKKAAAKPDPEPDPEPDLDDDGDNIDEADDYTEEVEASAEGESESDDDAAEEDSEDEESDDSPDDSPDDDAEETSPADDDSDGEGDDDGSCEPQAFGIDPSALEANDFYVSVLVPFVRDHTKISEVDLQDLIDKSPEGSAEHTWTIEQRLAFFRRLARNHAKKPGKKKGDW